MSGCRISSVAGVFFICIFSAALSRSANTEFALVPQSLIEDFGQAAGATPPSNERPLVPVAIAMIKHFEGWSDHPYNDPAGYCTIGYGHLIALRNCIAADFQKYPTKMSGYDGANLLEKDTLSARHAVSEYTTVDLNDDQFSALAVFTFNVGKKNFQNSTLLQLVNDQNYQKTGNQFMRWVNARGKKLQGLVDRRACEATLFSSSLSLNSKRQFDPKMCGAAGIQASVGAPIDILVGE